MHAGIDKTNKTLSYTEADWILAAGRNVAEHQEQHIHWCSHTQWSLTQDGLIWPGKPSCNITQHARYTYTQEITDS